MFSSISSRALSVLVFVLASGGFACASGTGKFGSGGGGSDSGSGGAPNGQSSSSTGTPGSGGAPIATSSSSEASSTTGVGGGGGAASSASSTSASSSSASSASSTSASSSASSGGPVQGGTCDLAATVSGTTLTLSGQFDDDPAVGGSCDTTPTNAVWFRYTAPAAGDYRIDVANATTTLAYSRLAVFDGGGCAPLGTELVCQTNSGATDSASVTLTDGQTVTILFHTDGDAYTMVDPEIDITPVVIGPGDDCGHAIDVTTATFPLQIPGSFDVDPAVGGSCDTTPTNALWFSYTAPAAGDYRFDLTNNTTTLAYSRLAFFDGIACSPLDGELACTTASAPTISGTLSLAAGQTVLGLFHTDGDSYTMVDPEISVTALGPGSAGDSCSDPFDVSSATLPYTLTGQFDADPSVGGSCDTTPNNAVWFEFTATTTGLAQFQLTNHKTTNAYSRIAVFDGAGCSPLGAELACVTANGKSGSATVSLQQGHTYLVLFHTDGDSYTMIDPEISVGPPPAGALCQTADDVTGATFPVQLAGTFDLDPPVGGSCDTSPTNAVWFSFTPPSTTTYTVSLANATTTNAYSRVAIFSGTACAPLGAEVACVTASGKSVQAMAALTAGQPYRIAFYTDGDSYSMVDPSITITP